MVTFDASRRISAADALKHRYFRTEPLPSSVDQLPKPRIRQQQQPAAPEPGPGSAAASGPGRPAGAAAADAAAAQQPGASTDGAAGAGSGVQHPAAGEPPAGAAAGTAQQQAGAHGPTATPPFGGRPLSGIPESLLGRGGRPQLDSSDMHFFKKRKFNLDDALDEEEPGSGGAAEGGAV